MRVATQRLVGRVVDDLVDDMGRIDGSRVHPRTFFDGLQPLEHADR